MARLNYFLIIFYYLWQFPEMKTAQGTNAHSNEITRLIEDHRSFCRISDSCNQTVWDFDTVCYCERCSCQPDCLETDTCCPETIKDLWNIPKPEVQQKCVPFSYRELFEREYYQFMFADCPSSFATTEENKEIVKRCERRHESTYLGDIIPVDDTTTDITYANEFCAKCHSIPEANLVRDWSATLKCNGSLFTPRSFETIVADISKTDCDIVVTPKQRRWQKSCRKVISTCNETKEWKSYDPFIEQACLSYRSTYMKKFRNPFCAICNGYEVKRHKRDETFCGIHTPSLVPFSALLNFDPDFKEVEVSVKGDCREDQIYDTIMNSCRDLQCEFGKRLVNDSCEPAFSQTKGLCYQIYIQLTQADGIHTENNNTDPTLADGVHTVEKNTGLERSERSISFPNPEEVATAFQSKILKFAKDYRMHNKIRNMSMYKMNGDENLGGSEIFVASLFVSSEITEVKDGDFLDGVKTSYVNSNITLTVGNENNSREVTFAADLIRVYSSHMNETILSPYTGEVVLPFYYELINWFLTSPCAGQMVITITDFNFKPFVLLDNISYSWDLNSTGVTINELNIFVENSLFRENENGSGIFVSADILRSVFEEANTRTTLLTTNSEAEGIVSITLMSLSTCCLLITLFTYTVFNVLRSQPGVNNMILCLCYITGYLIFMFGVSRVHLDPGCQIIGGVIHFTWIFAFFWMNVCSFHMYRVFGTLANPTHSTNRLFVTLSYLLYSSIGSLVVVGINIGVTYHISNGVSYGYGYGKTGLCYIYEPIMTLYTMTIPALCLVIVNMVMFAFVVVRCTRASNIQKHVQNDKSYFAIYVKLSTLTGLTWIAAIPMILLKSIVFNYVFIVLNCTQGVYLMMAFTCNKRIFKLYSGQYEVTCKGRTGFSIYGARSVTRSKSLSNTTSESLNLQNKVALNHI